MSAILVAVSTPLPELRPREPIDAPDYPQHAGEPVLRELDPTEFNMERLNRVGNGAGCAYQCAVGRGALSDEVVTKAVEELAARHPLMRARVVRSGEGDAEKLVFVDAGAKPELTITEMPELSRRWPELMEADMNAGPSPCWRTPPFRVALVRDTADPELWLLSLAGPHAFFDGISLGAVIGELLERLGGAKTGPALELREIPPTGAEAPTASGGGDQAPRFVAPEADIPSVPERVHQVQTGLIVEHLSAEQTRAMIQAGKARGITAHGTIGAAVHLAHAARHAALTGESPFGIYRSGSPVNLRPHVKPPLAPNDLRMAVDVAFLNTELRAQDSFWGLAERFAREVHQAVNSGAVLASWDQTQRRDRNVGSTGVPLLLISNIGRSHLSPSYGPLELEDVNACMATHGMFQINMALTSFRGRLGGSFYFETPTVSHASMRKFVDLTFSLLGSAKLHEGNPSLGELLG